MKRWLLHLRDLTMRITLAQSPRLAALDLMEMVISHSEIVILWMILVKTRSESMRAPHVKRAPEGASLRRA